MFTPKTCTCYDNLECIVLKWSTCKSADLRLIENLKKKHRTSTACPVYALCISSRKKFLGTPGKLKQLNQKSMHRKRTHKGLGFKIAAHALGLLGTYNRLTACLTQRCPQPTRNNTPKPVNLLHHVISICRSVCLSFSQSICQSVYLPIIPSANLPACLSFYPSIFIYLSIYLSIFLSTICNTKWCLRITTPLAQNGAPARIFQNSLGEGGFFKLEKAHPQNQMSLLPRHQTRCGPYTEVLQRRLAVLDFRNLKTHILLPLSSVDSSMDIVPLKGRVPCTHSKRSRKRLWHWIGNIQWALKLACLKKLPEGVVSNANSTYKHVTEIPEYESLAKDSTSVHNVEYLFCFNVMFNV